MEHSAEMRRCLVACDVAQARKLWAHISPHTPQPQSDDEALVVIHFARTQARSVPFKYRAYSHCWLTDNGFPSGLPDQLRPKAERMYPRVVEGVGIAMKTLANSILKPVVGQVRGAMEDAVLEAYCDSASPDVEHVKARMREAKNKSIEKLLGIKNYVGTR